MIRPTHCACRSFFFLVPLSLVLSTSQARATSAGASLSDSVDAAATAIAARAASGQRPQALIRIPIERFGEVLGSHYGHEILSSGGEIVAMWFVTQDSVLSVATVDRSGGLLRSTHAVGADFLKQFAPGADAGVPDRKDPLLAKSTDAPTGEHRPTDGRVYFMIHTTLKAAPVYVWGFSSLFGDINEQVAAGVGLLSIGASLWGSYMFTKGMELGYGKVALMNYGGEVGVMIPTFASLLLDAGTGLDERYRSGDTTCYPVQVCGGAARDSCFEVAQCDNDESVTPSEVVRAVGSMIGFPLGIFAGSRVRFAANHEYGNAAVMRDLSRFGVLYGFLLPHYANLEGDDYLTAASALSLVLVPAGFYAGYRLVDGQSVSAGRAHLLATSGIMGSLTGLFFASLFSDDLFDDFDERRELYTTTVLGGQALGTAFGWLYRREASYSLGQAVFQDLSALAGFLVGIGIPLIADADGHQAFVIPGIVGAWTGLILGERLSVKLFERGEEQERSARVSIEFSGAATLAAAMLSADRRGHLGTTPVRAQFLSVSF